VKSNKTHDQGLSPWRVKMWRIVKH